MNRRNASFAVVAMAAALLLLAGCATYYPDEYRYPPRRYTNTIHGTVDYVDAASRSIVLYDPNGGSVRVYYDNRTPVFWQGRDYRPDDLERGDRIDVTVRQSRDGLIAESANVTYNAHGGATTYPNNPYPPTVQSSSLIRGTVRYVEARSRTIQLDSNGTLVTLSYDNRVQVDVDGQPAPVANLERGDVVEVETQNDGNNSANLFATRITLIRDVRR